MYQNDRDPYHRNDPYMPPIDQQGFFAEEHGLKKAREAQTLGLISLSGLCTVLILAIVFGILAINAAKASQQRMGCEVREAKNGRIFGSIGLVGGIISFAFSFVMILLLML